MKSALKYFIVFICFIAVYAFCTNIAGAILIGIKDCIPFNIQSIIASSVALVAAFMVARLVWKNTTIGKVSFIGSVLIGGFVVGSIGFIVGFVGPIIFYPSSNQGPLLGIFITGPLGFVIGLIAGAIYWKVKYKK